MSLCITPPLVSMPSDSGVTSSRRMSLTSPLSTPAWTAAPMATTSSGLTDLLGSLPVISLTRSLTAGMRVEPPTMTTWSIWPWVSPASEMASSKGFLHRSSRSEVSSWNFERLRFTSRCNGPASVAVMNGRLICVLGTCDSSILAFSAASLRRWTAMLSLPRSTPCSPLNVSTSQSMTFWSQSSPPRLVSPWVLLTSKTPSAISRTDTSKVPPPRSKHQDRLLLVLLVEPVGQGRRSGLVDDCAGPRGRPPGPPPWWRCAARRRSRRAR